VYKWMGLHTKNTKRTIQIPGSSSLFEIENYALLQKADWT
jgi:hypothetical protein